MIKGLWKRITAVLICACMLPVCLYGCSDKDDTESNLPDGDVGTAPDTGEDGLFGTDGVKAAGSANAVYSALTGDYTAYYGTLPSFLGEALENTPAVYDAGDVAFLPESGYTKCSTFAIYGEYMYYVQGNTLYIVHLSGEEIQLVSEVELFPGEYTEGGDSQDPEMYDYGYENASGLFVSGDTLCVVTAAYHYSERLSDDSQWVYSEINSSKIRFYSIADPVNPIEMGSAGQDGNLAGAYMYDGTIYLVSSHSVTLQEGETSGFIPRTYVGDAGTEISGENIYMLPCITGSLYTVIGAYSPESMTPSSSAAVFGGHGRLYAGENALYMLYSATVKITGEEYTDGAYTVTDCTDTYATTGVKFALDGEISYAGGITVEGGIKSTYAIAEADGSLMFAATADRREYGQYLDAENGWSNDKEYESSTINYLYILNDDMSLLSGTEDISQREMTAVSFSGSEAYIQGPAGGTVIDITDKSAPKASDGSESVVFPYLVRHYADNLYFAINLTEDSSFEAVVYDVSDGVKEVSKLPIEGDPSPAVSSPGSVLINPEEGLVIVPLAGGAAVYRFDGNTLSYAGAFEFDYQTGGMMTALMGDTLYAVSRHGVTVCDVNAMTQLADVVFASEPEENVGLG